MRAAAIIEGSVSNGCVESDVILAAQEVLAGGEPRLVTYGITDEMAFGVGLPCGGEIDVFVEPHVGSESDVVLMVVAGDGVGEKLDDPELEQTARRRGRSHVFELEGRTVFADVNVPPPRLFVYGAVDTAEALCAGAKLLGWRTIVADARPRFATPERLPSADEILVLWPEEALEHVAPDAATAVVVLTHDDKFDLPVVRGVLATEATYLGWLGSRRNQERRRGLLLEEGVAEEDLDRVLRARRPGPRRRLAGGDGRLDPRRDSRGARRTVRAGRFARRALASTRRIAAMLLREVEYAKPDPWRRRWSSSAPTTAPVRSPAGRRSST